MKLEIKTNLDTKNFFFVFYNDRFMAALDASSFLNFETSLDKIRNNKYVKGKKLAKEFADFLVNNLRKEYFNIVPFFYLWTLKSGYTEIVRFYETRMFRYSTQKIPLYEGSRWLIVFDSMINADNRFEIFNEWIKHNEPVTLNEKIEKWIALHGLLLLRSELNPSNLEKVVVLYLDFIKEPQNLDIERTFGEVIEDDFLRLKNRSADKRKKNKSSEISHFLDNWLMRRYAMKEVFGSFTLWSIGGISLLSYFTFLVTAFLISENTQPIDSKFHMPAFIVMVLVFILTWWKGAWRLSRIIWGTAVGWLFIFSAAFSDLVYTKFEISKDSSSIPQLLQLKGFEILGVIGLFVGIVGLIIFSEINEEASVKPLMKVFKRLASVSIFSLFFGLLEGIMLISLVSWYFSEIHCWFNKWVVELLAVGTFQAMAIGVLTQLIWQNNRLTEIMRK